MLRALLAIAEFLVLLFMMINHYVLAIRAPLGHR